MPVRDVQFDFIDDQTAAVLRQRTLGERIQMTGDANDMARLMAAAGVRHRFPGWTETEVQREVARRMLGAAD